MNSLDFIRHTAVLRESQLASGLVGSGVTALGNADFARVGLYHQAFFGLSIGLERLCKLVFIADYAVRNGGVFPSVQELKKLGHDLVPLFDICSSIGARVKPNRDFSGRPATQIHVAIAGVLTEFAKSTRYYNLDFLTNPANHTRDPIAAWWQDVAEPILTLHYRNSARVRDESQATVMEAMLRRGSVVLHTAETGERIDTISAMMKRTGANRIVQKYGRLYTLQIVRWLAAIACELSHEAGHGRKLAALSYFHEPLTMFMNDDGYLRSRKSWVLYR